MVPGFHTQKIVEEIFRLSENTSKSLVSIDATAFDWLNKYVKDHADNLPSKMEQLELAQQHQGGAALSTSKSLTSFGEESSISADSDMNRQDIASGGIAPIVARESVF